MKRNRVESLYSQKKIAGFILAIARGADIDEKYRGVPLVRHYFKTLLQCGDILREPSPTMLKKLKVLVTAGADTSEIVYHEFDDLILNLCRELALLSVLLESDSAQRELTGFRQNLLKGFQQMLEDIAEKIGDTGLVDDLGEMASPLEQVKELRDELKGITGLEDGQT